MILNSNVKRSTRGWFKKHAFVMEYTLDWEE